MKFFLRLGKGDLLPYDIPVNGVELFDMMYKLASEHSNAYYSFNYEYENNYRELNDFNRKLMLIKSIFMMDLDEDIDYDIYYNNLMAICIPVESQFLNTTNARIYNGLLPKNLFIDKNHKDIEVLDIFYHFTNIDESIFSKVACSSEGIIVNVTSIKPDNNPESMDEYRRLNINLGRWFKHNVLPFIEDNSSNNYIEFMHSNVPIEDIIPPARNYNDLPEGVYVLKFPVEFAYTIVDFWLQALKDDGQEPAEEHLDYR